MRFQWSRNVKRNWHIWENFQELLELVESVEGPDDSSLNWLAQELEVVGEAGLSTEFLKLNRSGRNYSNPNQSSLAYFLGFTQQPPKGPPINMKPSQGRLSMPDIDLDVEDRYRDRLLDYVRDTYGVEKTAQIVTFGEIGAKKAVRDVARVLDMPYELGDRLSKAMPPGLFGVPATLNRVTDKPCCFDADEFRNLYESDEDAKTVVDMACKLEGQWRDRSMHAGAILVADRDISDYVPVARLSDKPEAPVVIQWDFVRAEECGLLKIDCLGLRNLSVIHGTLDLLPEEEGLTPQNVFELTNNPDADVFKMLARGHNIGVFQMESAGFRDLMQAIRPTDMNDISAMLALYRPGPMGSGVHIEYAKRKAGLKPVRYLHESLEPIFKETYGLLLYQEQLLEAAKKVAGMDTFQADYLRGVVGKKKVKEMPKQRNKFVQGCIDTVGMPRIDAETFFNEIEHHASYSFSKNHSVAYGFIAYVTAHLKLKYPLEYMTALLTSVSQSSSSKRAERMRLYLNECKNLGIRVNKPSINASKNGFRIVDNELVFGFDGIAGFGDTTIDQILETQDKANPYMNLFDFMRRASPGVLNRKAILQLLKSGAFDELLLENSPGESLARNQKIETLFGESQQLGVFLDQHPFQDLRDLVVDKANYSIGDISQHDTEVVRMAGIITSVTKKTTKAGKRMFTLTMEDDSSSVDVLVFPKVAENLPEEKPFVTGELIIVTGKVRLEGKPSTDTEDGNSEEESKYLLVYMDGEKIEYADISTQRPIYLKATKVLTQDRFKQIHDIIEANSGDVSVIMEVPSKLGRNVKIRFEKTTSQSVESILQKLTEV